MATKDLVTILNHINSAFNHTAEGLTFDDTDIDSSQANVQELLEWIARTYGKAWAGSGVNGVLSTSGNINLANDVCYQSATVNNNHRVNTLGMRIFSREFINLNGSNAIISCNGYNGEDGEPGNPGEGGAAIVGSCGSAIQGYNGVNGLANGEPNIPNLQTNCLGGAAGAGGGTTNTYGGAADTKLSINANLGATRNWLMMLGHLYGTTNPKMNGGLGGASGGSEATYASGGGGGGAAISAAVTPWIYGSGKFEAIGGTGGSGNPPESNGGSGGGGGGVWFFIRTISTGTWMIDVSGGGGGQGASSASPGNPGGSGQSFTVTHY